MTSDLGTSDWSAPTAAIVLSGGETVTGAALVRTYGTGDIAAFILPDQAQAGWVGYVYLLDAPPPAMRLAVNVPGRVGLALCQGLCDVCLGHPGPKFYRIDRRDPSVPGAHRALLLAVGRNTGDALLSVADHLPGFPRQREWRSANILGGAARAFLRHAIKEGTS